VEINLEKILATDRDPKVREAILEELFAEADRAGNIIFVVHNFDTYMSSGEGRVDLTIPLEKFLRSDRIHVIGITTPFAYQKFLFAKQILKSHFTILEVKEITPEITLQILLEHAHRFEARYRVILPYETLLTSVQKSAFFITDIPFPEKALMVVDECCNRVIKSEAPRGQMRTVMADLVDLVLAERTHVPTTLTSVFKVKLLTIYDKLNTYVIGQQQTMGELSAALQRSFLMVGKRKKPLASFLFLGPTGVGKTETAKVLAREFFESENTMIRFDMSEFQRVEDIARLIGDPVSGDPGLLVSTIREKPYGVLLLDEMEKAHHDLLNIFLTLLDEGYITDSLGKHVDCKSLVVIGTSNAGALEFFNQASLSISSGAPTSSEGNLPSSDPVNLTAYKPTIDIMSFLIEKQYFSPEFLNRFDGVIAFAPLSSETAFVIGRKMVQELALNIQNLHNVTITVSDETLKQIITKHFNPAYGARDLQRAIQEQVENIIAQKILSGEAGKGSAIEI
jgi:ATP-dependent Clp protease ATP-binding subunit ClpA